MMHVLGSFLLVFVGVVALLSAVRAPGLGERLRDAAPKRQPDLREVYWINDATR